MILSDVLLESGGQDDKEKEQEEESGELLRSAKEEAVDPPQHTQRRLCPQVQPDEEDQGAKAANDEEARVAEGAAEAAESPEESVDQGGAVDGDHAGEGVSVEEA